MEKSEHYLNEAKRLKHVADELVDRLAKSIAYIEAVLSFLLCGYSMEHDKNSEPQRIYLMYRDTFHLLKYVFAFINQQKKLICFCLKISA